MFNEAEMKFTFKTDLIDVKMLGEGGRLKENRSEANMIIIIIVLVENSRILHISTEIIFKDCYCYFVFDMWYALRQRYM